MITLEPAGALYICGDGGCAGTAYLRCRTCGWTCEAPTPPPVDDDGQLALDLAEQPVHTELDCRRRQREKGPRPAPNAAPRFRSANQQRAHNAYARIHAKHRPARLVRRHGALTCPVCGFQP